MISIRYTFYLICDQPDVRDNITRELTQAFKARARIVSIVGLRKHGRHGMVGAVGRSLPIPDRCIVPASGHLHQRAEELDKCQRQVLLHWRVDRQLGCILPDEPPAEDHHRGLSFASGLIRRLGILWTSRPPGTDGLPR